MTAADRIHAQPPAVRRALALLLIPVAAALLWALVFMPVRWVTTSQSEWRETTGAELARARGHAQQLQSLQKQVAELPSAPVWVRLYEAGSGSSGGAAVQQDIASLCAAAGLESQSITALPSEVVGVLTKQPIRLTATGTADRLATFITRLREQPRYLRVDRLLVTSPQVQNSDQNPVLSVTMDIAGFSAAVMPKGKRT